jgi:hypothetical protein
MQQLDKSVMYSSPLGSTQWYNGTTCARLLNGAVPTIIVLGWQDISLVIPYVAVYHVRVEFKHVILQSDIDALLEAGYTADLIHGVQTYYKDAPN